VQSANDTLTNNDRVHIQNEVNQLVSEIDRIAQSTQYNQISLLNKNSAVTLQNAGDALQFHIGANTNRVSGAAAVTTGDNTIQFNVPAGRAQDLGDVKTLKSIDATITAGNFTINGTAIEASLTPVLQFVLHKNAGNTMKWPRAEDAGPARSRKPSCVCFARSPLVVRF